MASAVGEPLRIVADVWPPYTGSGLEGNGLATELVSTALKRKGYETEYSQVPTARIIKELESGGIDIMVAAWLSEDRKRIGLFSKPYLVNRILFVQRSESSINFDKLSDLRPYRIAIARGYRYGGGIDLDSTLKKVGVKDFNMAARMLMAKRVDLALDDELVVRYYLDHDLVAMKGRFKFISKPLVENGLYILVRLTHPLHRKIVEDFNSSIMEMCEDNTYQEVFARHGLQLGSPEGYQLCRPRTHILDD